MRLFFCLCYIYAIITEQQTQVDCTCWIKREVQFISPDLQNWLTLKLLTGQTDDDGLLNETGVSRNLTDSQWQPCPLSEKSKLWFHVELSGNGNVTPWQTEFCPIQSAAGGLLLRRIHCPKREELKSTVVRRSWPHWSILHLVRSLCSFTKDVAQTDSAAIHKICFQSIMSMIFCFKL